MTSLLPFAFDDALVRTHKDEHGAPWFVARDVCTILGLGNPSQALSNLDDDEKGITNTDTLGGAQEMLTVSESGLYSLKGKNKAVRSAITGRTVSCWIFQRES